MPRILAIDDKVDNLTTLSALLKLLIPDCVVTTAQSGIEGLQKAETELPDTILLDIKMPGMDGYEICRKLKENDKTKHIPVIMISAIHTNSTDLVKGLYSGADAYLAKPIDEYVLAAQVNTTLRIKKAEDQLRNQKNMLEKMVMERTKDLLEREKRYRILFEQSMDAVLLFDADTGKIVDFNRNAHENLGYTREEFAKIKVSDIDAIKPQKDINEQIKTIIKKGCDEFEAVFAKKDGKLRNLQVKSKMFSVNDRRFIQCICSDITHRKQMETQLQQARKMESIGTLSGGIAHDFNNILGIIIGNTELALDNVPKWNPIHINLTEIKNASLRAADIVRQLLSFSHKTEQKLKPTDFKILIEDSLKFLKSLIPSTIEVRTNLNAQARTILADPTQINQIMMNLCINASQAMEQTGGRLDIKLDNLILDEKNDSGPRDLHHGHYTRLTVADNGPGIPPEIIDRIFDPYFTTKEVGKGSGIGLAVVHGLVKNHSGAISVDSKTGKGTTFTIFFPIIKDKPQLNDAADKKFPHGTENILFVDDESAIVSMIKKMLESLGYNVETRQNPVEALAVFHSRPHSFDLVITDMTMPKMTGVTLSEKIMKIRCDVPVIICTGHNAGINGEKARSMGISAYVMKPISKQDLAITVRRVLDAGENGT